MVKLFPSVFQHFQLHIMLFHFTNLMESFAAVLLFSLLIGYLNCFDYSNKPKFLDSLV